MQFGFPQTSIMTRPVGNCGHDKENDYDPKVKAAVEKSRQAKRKKYLREDASQAAARIVREATEQK